MQDKASQTENSEVWYDFNYMWNIVTDSDTDILVAYGGRGVWEMGKSGQRVLSYSERQF